MSLFALTFFVEIQAIAEAVTFLLGVGTGICFFLSDIMIMIHNCDKV